MGGQAKGMRTIGAVVVALLLASGLAGCTPSKSTDQPIDYSAIPLPKNARPDSTALPDVGPATAWTAAETEAASKPGYGAQLISKFRETGDLGTVGLLEILRESGIAVADVSLKNAIVVEPKARSDGMSIQAGQVLLLDRFPRDQKITTLNQLFAAYVASGIGLSADDWRSYAGALMSDVSAPSQAVWVGVINADGDQSPTLGAALASGQDYSLTALQATLLGVRMEADALITASWLKAHPTVPLSELGSAKVADVAPSVSLRRATHAESKEGGPCGGIPIPDFVFDATAASAGKMWEKLVELGKISGGEALIKASGIANVIATGVNAILTWALLDKTMSAESVPVVRTKKTDEDQARTTLTAKFTMKPTPLEWLNCLRVVAAIKTLAAAVPESGAWKDAAVTWKVHSGPATFPDGAKNASSTKTMTGDDGTTDQEVAGLRQSVDKQKATHEFDTSAYITAAISPESMKSAFDQLGRWSANALEYLFGIPSGGAASLNAIDVYIKALVFALNFLEPLWSAKLDLPMKDWDTESRVVGVLQIHETDRVDSDGTVANIDLDETIKVSLVQSSDDQGWYSDGQTTWSYTVSGSRSDSDGCEYSVQGNGSGISPKQDPANDAPDSNGNIPASLWIRDGGVAQFDLGVGIALEGDTPMHETLTGGPEGLCPDGGDAVVAPPVSPECDGSLDADALNGHVTLDADGQPTKFVLDCSGTALNGGAEGETLTSVDSGNLDVS
jgi:hypothetical protein